MVGEKLMKLRKKRGMSQQNGIAYNVNTPEKIGGGHVPSSVRTRV